MNNQAVSDMTRVQMALYLPASCIECGREYASVDDLLERDPRIGFGKALPVNKRFVDAACWAFYAGVR